MDKRAKVTTSSEQKKILKEKVSRLKAAESEDMDLIDVKCTKWRELFDVDSHEKIVRDRIAGAFQEGLESV